MNRSAASWIVVGVAVLGLAAVSVVLGLALLPPRATAEEVGTLGPWILTWGLVLMAALLAVTLGGFLIALGVRRFDRGARR